MTSAADMADVVAAGDREAVIMFLRHSGVPRSARVRTAASLVVASVFTQAGLLGLVECSRCGDRGCDWCLDATWLP